MAQAHRVSATATETLQLHEPSTSDSPPPQVQTVTLRLVPRIKKKVSWREDTVDNEHMEKKKSKICCIFHKDDDCDSDDGNDGDGDGEGKGKGKEQDHHHECNHAKDYLMELWGACSRGLAQLKPGVMEILSCACFWFYKEAARVLQMLSCHVVLLSRMEEVGQAIRGQLS